MNTYQIRTLQELTQLNAISGQENEVAKYLLNRFRKLNVDILKDNLGNIVALKKSKCKDAPKVLLDGHMDEVGFMVINILPNGLIKAQSIGGIDPLIVLSKRVLLTTKSKEIIEGCVSAIAPHLAKESKDKKPEIKDMLFDFGFENLDDALSHGAYIGAQMVMEGTFQRIGKHRLLAKAFDDRYGVALGLNILEELNDYDLPFDLYVSGSVQEEVGLRGARAETYVVQPDLAIILDCSPARDAKENNEEVQGELGQGLLIRYLDGGMIPQQKILKMQIEACKKANVKYQMFFSPGNTNASLIHKENDGILTLTHCICARNIHSCSSIIDMRDYDAAFLSLIELLKSLDKAKIDSLKEIK